MNDLYVTAQDRKHLRELAKKQLEYSMLPIMDERRALWYRHNDLRGDIPLIHVEALPFEDELLPPPKCTSDTGLLIERQLNRSVMNHEYIDDDKVVPSHYAVGRSISFRLFGLDIEKETAQDSQGRELGHYFKHPIRNLHDDMHVLKKSQWSAHTDKADAYKAFVEDLLGDILPVKFCMGSLGACLSQRIVHLMGMESMIFAMMDYPDDFHALMQRLTKDHIEFMRWMENEGLLSPNSANDGINQGTFGFTNDLPTCRKTVSTHDMWGHMDSQETVSISPDMFGEFFFDYYNEVAKNFGLLCYGCCEPVNPIWESYISKLPNLRKVSISAWCDEEYMGEALRDSRVIYHRKPHPRFVGVGKNLDEDAYRRHILKTLKCARDCKLEFTFRDIYTLEGNAAKPRRAVQILRELIHK